MNRYQHEVAEMDRRHRLIVRALSFAGAATLIVVALWSAGLPPTQWWASVHAWRSDGRDEQTAPASIVARPTHGSASTTTAPAPTTTPPADGSISPTPKRLYLVSTSPGKSLREGTARLGTSLERPQTYVWGALLANGARIEEIHRDHVVLKRGDEVAKVYVHGHGPSAAAADLIMVGGPQPAVITSPSTREELTDYLRPSPVFDGESIRGYEVYPGRNSGVFAQLGLQPGDIIVSINDAPVIDVVVAIDSLKEITRGASVVVGLERKGARTRLVLDGALITSDQSRARDASLTSLPAGD